MNLADIVHYVRLETPLVMDAIIVQTMAAVAMDFCMRTKVWSEVQDPIPLVDGVSQYDMEPVTGARVVEISRVWLPIGEVLPITLDTLAQVLPNWQSATAFAPRYYNAARDWDSLTVFPTPLGANRTPMTFRAVYAPLRTTLTLPDFLADRFLDPLVSGTKARLMTQVNVPWSNPPAGLMHKDIYEGEVLAARIAQLHDRVPGALTVQPRRFF